MTDSKPDPADLTETELREDIVRTREDLGETVAALVAKTDVKARVSGRLSQWAGRARGGVRRLTRRGDDQR